MRYIIYIEREKYSNIDTIRLINLYKKILNTFFYFVFVHNSLVHKYDSFNCLLFPYSFINFRIKINNTLTVCYANNKFM